MRRFGRLLKVGAPAVAVSAVIAGSVAALVGTASADTNTITNPGFESGLSGWSCGAAGAAVTGHARAGTYALAGAAGSSDNAQCAQTVTVAPSTKYTVSAYVN